MPFVTEIVEGINSSLKGSLLDKRFQASNYIGLTTVVLRNITKTSAELFPGVVDLNGEAVPVEFNDTANMIIYHKMISNTHTKTKASYGDSYLYGDVTEMQMIIFAWSNKIQMNADQLEAIIRVNLPERVMEIQQDLGLNKCLITTTGTDHDKLKVFKQEFPQASYFLRPENIFFLIKYRIETAYNKECLNQCCPGWIPMT